MQLFERLESAHARWNVLEHPFYRRWECGELTRPELAWYAAQYRHAVVALAEVAEAAGAEHAAEEQAHVALWDAFAHAVGSEPAEAAAETRECAEAWTGGADPLERLAVLYAVESAQPAIAGTKLSGLLAHYGFEAGDAALEYFSLHAELDVEHAELTRVVLAREAGDADAGRLTTAAERALRGNWRLLDGVEAWAAG